MKKHTRILRKKLKSFKPKLKEECGVFGISNIDVRHGRVEEQQFEQPFDHIVSRAFAALDKMVSLSHMHLSKTGQFLAMKGLDPINEQEALGDRYEIKKTINLDVPGCEAQRHLIILSKD